MNVSQSDQVNQPVLANGKRPASVVWGCGLLVVYLIVNFSRVAFSGQYQITNDMLWIMVISAIIFFFFIAAIYRGSTFARGILLFFSCFNAGLAVVAGTLYSRGIITNYISHWVDFGFNILGLIAVLLLFSPSARLWFKAQKAEKK